MLKSVGLSGGNCSVRPALFWGIIENNHTKPSMPLKRHHSAWKWTAVPLSG